MLRVSKVKKVVCQKLGIVLLEEGNVMIKP
jgi:hypothetical protein